MIYLNPETTNFSKDIVEDIYVDKTLFIEKIVKRIDEEDSSIAYILPRRFGKTSLADMLVSYLSKGADSRDLFSDKKIAQIPNWDENLNKHNVIHMNMKFVCKFLSMYGNLENTINNCLNNDLIEAYPEISINPNDDVIFNFLKIFSKTKEKFIFIIDEYDVVYREEEYIVYKKEYLNFLNSIAKDSPQFVSLVYLTGILPVMIGNSESELNNVQTISIIDSMDYEDFIGFKEDEVKGLCEKYNERNDITKKVKFSEVKRWYNGYKLENKTSIYNPYAIKQALSKEKPNIKNHWGKTSSFESLKKYIIFEEKKVYKDEIGTKIEDIKLKINSKIQKLKESGVYEDIALLAKTEDDEIPKNRVKVKLSRDVTDLNSVDRKDHLYTLLIFLGYLTYDYKSKECYIPNKEIIEVFDDIISANDDYRFLNRMINDSRTLFEKTVNLNAKYVADNFQIVHRHFSDFKFYNNEGAFQSFISIAYYYPIKDYSVKYEYKYGEGYADAVFIPRKECKLSKETERPPMVIELKYGKESYIDPKEAIKQIKEKEYFDEMKEEGFKTIILVGLTYCKNDKDVYQHYCEIEKYEI